MREPSTFLKRKTVANDESFALLGGVLQKGYPFTPCKCVPKTKRTTLA